jgi:hypothetical protein
LDPERSLFLPIPIDSSRPIARSEAKQKLGFDSDALLLLTIASPFKYQAPGRTGFLDLVTPVMKRSPRAVLVAVGPEASGAWEMATRATGGRILALGTRWDNDLLYAAADIYLDSVPFSSITSILEAGSRGSALVGYAPLEPELELLGPGAPGLDGVMPVAHDEDSYRALLCKLIEDREYRATVGHAVQERIAQTHMGENWRDSVQRLYMLPVSQRGCLVRTNDEFEVTSLSRVLFQLYGEWNTPQMIRNLLAPLPYATRIWASMRLYKTGFPLSIVSLLPPPVHSIALAFGRRVVGTARRVRRSLCNRRKARSLKLDGNN